MKPSNTSVSSGDFRIQRAAASPERKAVRFTFDGKEYLGREGDTIASALLASGVHMLARSFKYHRPRGIIGAGAEDPAALVQVGADKETWLPNVRATEARIYDGMVVSSQNCWPSLHYDVGALIDAFAKFVPAGFYYKTFMGPPGNWMFFEPRIRAAAGLGRAPSGSDPDRYEHINHHCDVLVIGAGGAGLAAARQASLSGARVTLVDENPSLGGSLLDTAAHQVSIDGMEASAWARQVSEQLATTDNVEVLTTTCAVGYHHDNWVVAWQNVLDHIEPARRAAHMPRHRLWRIRARRVVLATGAIERPITFNNNDRPGIMLASAARRYLNRHDVVVGREVALFTNNDTAYQAAFDLRAAGVSVAAIIDTRADPPSRLIDRAEELMIPRFSGAWIVDTAGRNRVRAITVQAYDGEGTPRQRKRIACDTVLMSGGWSPNVSLFSQSRGKLRWDDELVGFRPHTSWQNEESVGGCNGVFSLADCLQQGAMAGASSAALAGFGGGEIELPALQIDGIDSYTVEPAWCNPHLPVEHGRCFVDFQNDVTAKDIKLALSEGYTSVEHLKRYTTLGMATDQGKTSSVNGFGVMSRLLSCTMPEVGVTTQRPLYKPISMGSVAGQHVGDLYHARRTTPMHACHEEAGATFEIVGDWLRARVYPRGEETFESALQRESWAARHAVGLMDASTLGKIDIRGKGAREFLHRVYTNSWLKLAPGKCRYGLMLGEDGMVFDDGVTACLAEDHFHMTTTTGGAARVLTWLEDYHQTEWSDLSVFMTSVTEQWAVASLCGPGCDKLLAQIVDDVDVAPDNFPFMTFKTGHIQGVPVRIFRISFTGELSYEINVAARYGDWLWRLIMEHGAGYGITPYGTEAMHLLRAEKGFIIVGQDTDGTVTPRDLGMSWALKGKADFIGKRSLFRSDTAREGRLQFVGLLTEDDALVCPEGSQIIASARKVRGGKVPMIGHVTSAYFSPNLGRSIALGFVRDGHSRLGETVYVARLDGAPKAATICEADFLAAAKTRST